MTESLIKTKIKKDLIDSMKSGQKEIVEVLRYILSFINSEEKEQQKVLDDSSTIKVLKKILKKNQDAFEQFKKASRNDLAEREEKEINILQNYLPAEMKESEIIKIIVDCIKKSNASDIKDMGKVMSEIKKIVNESVDMSVVSKHVKEMLSK
tara:strand:- start:277 stop:732 length:456 start_codon:yes stop_codon:yes gene_type:complete